MGSIDTRYFPVFVDIERRPCVVVGEGREAEKRIRQLLKYEADVVVFTSTPSAWVLEAEAEGRLTIERRPFLQSDLQGMFLAVCATDDPSVRSAMLASAERLGCLLNIAGDAKASSFILPSITHRDPIQIGVSTAGAAPELAKRLRKVIEAAVSAAWGPWVRLVAEVRGRALAAIDDAAAREVVMGAVLDDSVLARLEAGETPTADEFLALAPTPQPATAGDEGETGDVAPKGADAGE